MGYEFKIDDEQVARFKKWADKQIEETGGRPTDSFGFRFQFLFGPTGWGDNVEAIDTHTNKRINLTRDDDGEFCFDENGKPNWESPGKEFVRTLTEVIIDSIKTKFKRGKE